VILCNWFRFTKKTPRLNSVRQIWQWGGGEGEGGAGLSIYKWGWGGGGYGVSEIEKERQTWGQETKYEDSDLVLKVWAHFILIPARLNDIFLFLPLYRARICKHLRSLGSIARNRLRQGGDWFLGSLKGLQIRAQDSVFRYYLQRLPTKKRK
jgi:hypothetical protein